MMIFRLLTFATYFLLFVINNSSNSYAFTTTNYNRRHTFPSKNGITNTRRSHIIRMGRKKAFLHNDKKEKGIFEYLLDHAQRSVAPSFGAALMLFSTILIAPVDIGIDNNSPIPIIKVSKAAALTENQQQVSDVWSAVSAQYFDSTYNGLGEKGWREKRNEAVDVVLDLGPDDKEEVTKAIQSMLGSLGDPYTRFLPKEKFELITNYARGSVRGGVGVQLLLDPRENKVMIMGVSEGGPAKLAGITQGDIILQIDGESMEGESAECVAAKLKGESGSKASIKVRHIQLGEEGQTSTTELYTVTRSIIKVNPVEASTFVSEDTNTKIGLLKLASFSKETTGQIVDAIRLVKSNGAESIVIDLRGNVGGYMPAGVDAASLFLPAKAHIIAEVNNRAGTAYFKGYDADGIGADTSIPVVLLVDSRTASAAEIFTAALQDNKRAVVVGTSKTFGKGRIQNVQSLQDGSGVAVTRARYLTPKGRDIHGIGITPNKELQNCKADDTAMNCLSGIV